MRLTLRLRLASAGTPTAPGILALHPGLSTSGNGPTRLLRPQRRTAHFVGLVDTRLRPLHPPKEQAKPPAKRPAHHGRRRDPKTDNWGMAKALFAGGATRAEVRDALGLASLQAVNHYIDGLVAAGMPRPPRAPRGPRGPNPETTARKAEAARLFAKGKGPTEVGRWLGVSRVTASKYRRAWLAETA